MPRRIFITLPGHALAGAGVAGAKEEAPVSESLRQQAREAMGKNHAPRLDAPDLGADRKWLSTARPLSPQRDLAAGIVLEDTP